MKNGNDENLSGFQIVHLPAIPAVFAIKTKESRNNVLM